MEKKDNVEKGVSGKPEEKKSAAYYEKRPEFGNRGPSKILLHFRKGITFFLVIADFLFSVTPNRGYISRCQ